MYLEDADNGLLCDGREWYNFGQSSQKLRAEVPLHNIHQVIVGWYHAFGEGVDYVLAADVGCEKYEAVGKVADSSQSVVQFAFV